MSNKNQAAKTSTKDNAKPKDELIIFAFTKQNYLLLLIGIVFITIGFLLMIGGGSDDPSVFSYKIFNFQRITLAPILIIIGYIIEIYAIMKKPKN